MVLHFGSTRLKISFAIQSRVKEWYILRVFLGKMQESCSMIAPIELFLIFSVWASSGSSYLWNLARPPSCLIMSAIVRFSLLFWPNSFQWEHTKSVYYNRPLSTKIAIRIAATDFPELNTWVKLSGPYPTDQQQLCHQRIHKVEIECPARLKNMIIEGQELAWNVCRWSRGGHC